MHYFDSHFSCETGWLAGALVHFLSQRVWSCAASVVALAKTFYISSSTQSQQCTDFPSVLWLLTPIHLLLSLSPVGSACPICPSWLSLWLLLIKTIILWTLHFSFFQGEPTCPCDHALFSSVQPYIILHFHWPHLLSYIGQLLAHNYIHCLSVLLRMPFQ